MLQPPPASTAQRQQQNEDYKCQANDPTKSYLRDKEEQNYNNYAAEN